MDRWVWVGLARWSGFDRPFVVGSGHSVDEAKETVRSFVSSALDTSSGPTLNWSGDRIQKTQPVSRHETGRLRGIIAPWDPRIPADEWLDEWALDPLDLLTTVRTRRSPHEWNTGTLRRVVNWRRWEASVMTGLSRILAPESRLRATIVTTTVLLLLDAAVVLGARYCLSIDVTAGLESLKRTVVDVGTDLTFALTGFVLTGLAVVAVAAIVFDQDAGGNGSQDPDDPDPTENEGEFDLPPEAPEDAPDDGEQLRHLGRSFKQGTYLTVSASLFGIVFQAIDDGLVWVAAEPEPFATLPVFYMLYYTFVGLFVGMVFTTVDIAELVLGVVEDELPG